MSNSPLREPGAPQAHHVGKLIGGLVLAAVALWGVFMGVDRDRGEYRESIQSVIPPPEAPTPGPAPSSAAYLPQPTRDLLESSLGDSRGHVAAVVMDDSGAVLLGSHEDDGLELLSVAKVYILANYLDMVTADHRPLTPDEQDELRAMIEISNNDAAWDLWRDGGGLPRLQAFLTQHNLPAPRAGEDDSWGSLLASPRDVGSFLFALYHGTLLDRGFTNLALSLMSDVDSSQAWGVSAGLEDDQPGHVYLKNGWYSDDDGDWSVDSAAIVVAPGKPDYAMVVLTSNQPTYEGAIGTIEDAARQVNSTITTR